jgi:alkylation response protein AidB-like acyl-CoA dehydrogenase
MSQPHPILAAARDLAPFIRDHAEENEGLRRLSDPVVAALRPTGMFRMPVAKDYGGPEVEPATMVEVLEELAAADAATGWCAMISSTTSSLSAFLSKEWAERVFADPLAAYGGAFAPNGRGITVDGGWVVDGRWMWGSGTQHCAWVNGGVMTDEREMRLMFFARDQVEWLDNWDSVGLRGSGSGDYTVTRGFVPRGREIHVGKVWSQVDSPVGRFPNFNLLAIGVASMCLGLARRAIDELVVLLGSKVSTAGMSRSKASEYVPAQMAVAEAQARYRSARTYLFDEVALTWEVLLRGDRPDTERRAATRLACHHVAIECARAVDLCYNAGGGSSVFMTGALQRVWRDMHTATQHAMLSDRNALTYGRLRLGLEADTVML